MTLGTISWGWKGKATRTGKNWSVDKSETGIIDVKIDKESSVLPIWTKKMKDYQLKPVN